MGTSLGRAGAIPGGLGRSGRTWGGDDADEEALGHGGEGVTVVGQHLQGQRGQRGWATPAPGSPQRLRGSRTWTLWVPSSGARGQPYRKPGWPGSRWAKRSHRGRSGWSHRWARKVTGAAGTRGGWGWTPPRKPSPVQLVPTREWGSSLGCCSCFRAVAPKGGDPSWRDPQGSGAVLGGPQIGGGWRGGMDGQTDGQPSRGDPGGPLASAPL